jgi:hypothetical protein
MQITVSRNETKYWVDKLENSAEVSMLSIANLAADKDAMSFLYECKFHEDGFDPLEYTKPLHFVE